MSLSDCWLQSSDTRWTAEGLEGILVRDKQTRLVLSVALLQRSVAVEIDRAGSLR